MSFRARIERIDADYFILGEWNVRQPANPTGDAGIDDDLIERASVVRLYADNRVAHTRFGKVADIVEPFAGKFEGTRPPQGFRRKRIIHRSL